MQLDMSQFQDAFFEESAEHLSSLEEGLLKLETSPDDQELLPSIFRAAHSIKGASGMFGFSDVTRFTHVMENLLDDMRDGKIAPSPPLVDLLLRATDLLKELIDAAQNQPSAADPADLPAQMEPIRLDPQQPAHITPGRIHLRQPRQARDVGIRPGVIWAGSGWPASSAGGSALSGSVSLSGGSSCSI